MKLKKDRPDGVDLHIHSVHSDGANTVDELIGIARERGLAAISITDHDTLDAYPYAIEEGKRWGIEVIPGTELSCEYKGTDIHILSYFLDYENTELRQMLKNMRDARYFRAKKMVTTLNSLGVDLRFETVLRFSRGGAIGRPHIATALLHEEFVYSFREAFDKYIGYDSPAYVEKMHVTPEEIFSLVRRAGGVPILAHPGVTAVDDFLPELVQQGLAGLEVYHSDHGKATRKRYAAFCKKHRLLFTGGSDFHCDMHRPGQSIVGDPYIRYSLLAGLKKRYASFL
ncbi:PHP domain-containing protein [Chitinivibrio alkaliphilus]|uniref:PHP domain protein n=1 Tax=Chitinivibrio alkaliphilus ACht1 TaxID=1313304 RepID=U7DBK2_9BACT|nr:PHP domain-containing protein [Chitinivibrio alkaliphilus]ERP38948.1 PHP domain protein [Chitinivibrio alkaliphilus ACht1]